MESGSVASFLKSGKHRAKAGQAPLTLAKLEGAADTPHTHRRFLFIGLAFVFYLYIKQSSLFVKATAIGLIS